MGSEQRRDRLDPPMAYLTEGLLEHGGGILAYRVRLLCTEVWPMLYHMLTIQQGNGLGGVELAKAQSNRPPATRASPKNCDPSLLVAEHAGLQP
jgi:hypothetical protein